MKAKTRRVIDKFTEKAQDHLDSLMDLKPNSKDSTVVARLRSARSYINASLKAIANQK